MTEGDQIEHFYDDLSALIKRYSQEYELRTASVIGCLFMKMQELGKPDNSEESGNFDFTP